MRWRVRPAQVGAVLLAALAAAPAGTGCGDDEDAGTAVRTIIRGHGLDRPTAVALRPGADAQLWVTNSGDDSITIVGDAAGDARADTRRDAYAEHFVARPSGLAFDSSGGYFAVSNDSNNGLRGLVFRRNPERNRNFKGNNFMGPALFNAETFAVAGQSKRYLGDWPQPGYGHAASPGLARSACPEYWSTEARRCEWPREGSHLDMLHGSPNAGGIHHLIRNEYLVLDGCGSRTARNRCRGDGHVVVVDFNRDHQEGNGFHGDGVIRRYIDAPYRRLPGAGSGIAAHDGWIYYSDTGAGVVRRMRPASGRREVLVDAWHRGAVTHGAQGPGVISWANVPRSPGDGDHPDVIDAWVEAFGDRRLIRAAGAGWIKPMELLGEYAYIRDSDVDTPLPDVGIRRPVGLAASGDSLFVADRATGRIHSFGWDGLRPGPVIETGLRGLSGLALDADAGGLVITDTASDGLYRVAIDE